jgi:hypothetical protein
VIQVSRTSGLVGQAGRRIEKMELFIEGECFRFAVERDSRPLSVDHDLRGRDQFWVGQLHTFYFGRQGKGCRPANGTIAVRFSNRVMLVPKPITGRTTWTFRR